ncbi:hypothetical protein ACFPJ1_40785 [Kribbella qitaiheensis]|uniref:hypothetical protein n=1 Tax=Kribbella qitaiheensis TaxID=1544730 RepID=UPI0036107977
MNKLKTAASTVWASRVARTAIAGVGAVALLVGGVTVANAASDCTNLMYPLCPRSVAKTQVVDGSLDGVEIKDGSLGAKEIAPADREAFLKDTSTPDVKGGARLVAVYNEVPIEKVGGSWKTNKTKLGEFTLPAGTWLINTSAFFRRTAASTDNAVTRPQLALRAGDVTTGFGSDYGTVMGSAISPVVEGDLTGSDVRLVQVPTARTIGVYAFAYQDDRGSSDSNKIEVLRAIVAIAAA